MAILIYKKKRVQLSNNFGKSGILLLGIQLMAPRIPAENLLHFNSFNIVFQTASIWDIFYSFVKHLLISAKYTVGNIDNVHFTGLGLYFLPILPQVIPDTPQIYYYCLMLLYICT